MESQTSRADRSDCNLLQKGFGDSVLSVRAKQQTEGLKNEPGIDVSKTAVPGCESNPTDAPVKVPTCKASISCMFDPFLCKNCANLIHC